MTVSEVMSTNVASVVASMPIANAQALMRRQRIHHLVVARGSDLLGVVSARDLSRRLPESARRSRTVADVMVRHVLTVDGQATLGRASYLMRGHSVGCLLVLGRGRVVGIVTAADLLGLLGRGAKHGRRVDTRTAIHHRVGHRHRSRGDGVW